VLIQIGCNHVISLTVAGKSSGVKGVIRSFIS